MKEIVYLAPVREEEAPKKKPVVPKVQAPRLPGPQIQKMTELKPMSPAKKKINKTLTPLDKKPVEVKKADLKPTMNPVKTNLEQLERFIQVTTHDAVDDEIGRYRQGIYEHIDRKLSPVYYPKRRVSLDGYPYYHGGAHPGYAAYPYGGAEHGYGGYGHPGYGGHHGYAPTPYDPRAYPEYDERRKTMPATADPGQRFSSPQHGPKTGKKSDFTSLR